MKQLPEFRPRSRKAWRAWLQRNHGSSTGIWVVYAKKHTGLATLSYDESVEEALCFGWIDSLRHPVDDQFWRMVFTPRKPKSVWSAPNRSRIAKLTAAGLMTAAGLAMVALAKKTGTWEALKHAEDLLVPPDLRKAINANTAAKKHWPNCTPAMRKVLLYRLHGAKRPETRAKRIAAIVSIAAKNLTMKELRAGMSPPAFS